MSPCPIAHHSVGCNGHSGIFVFEELPCSSSVNIPELEDYQSLCIFHSNSADTTAAPYKISYLHSKGYLDMDVCYYSHHCVYVGETAMGTGRSRWFDLLYLENPDGFS
jgi:hypothetical protein